MSTYIPKVGDKVRFRNCWWAPDYSDSNKIAEQKENK